MSGFGDTRYIIDILILRAHGIYSIWRNMAHVGLKDRFELPHSVARLFNVVKILGSAVTAVRSVVNIVYDFVVVQRNFLLNGFITFTNVVVLCGHV